MSFDFEYCTFDTLNIQNNKAMLPKFLLADNSQVDVETIYVVHNESPRFIVSGDIDVFSSNQKVYWIDDEPTSKEDVDRLVDEAEEFLEKELENQIDLFEEEGEED